MRKHVSTGNNTLMTIEAGGWKGGLTNPPVIHMV